jgi:2-phosphoglycerate kinase
MVTLVCGASGVGKSRVARALSVRYGAPLAETDDIVTALRAMTTSAQAPELHFWHTNPEALTWAPERIAEQHLRLADALRPGLQSVILDHIEFAAAVVLDGDYLVPDLANGFNGAVRAVVISEPDEGQLVENLLSREPDEPEQRKRARVSLLIEAELIGRAVTAGAPVVPARPWDTAPDRSDLALQSWHQRP